MGALLTTFGIDWHLLALQTANFAVLAVALSWLLYKPVMKIVGERQAVIAKGVDEALEASHKLAAADTAASERVHGAEKEAEEIVKGARSEAATEKAALIKEAEARAAQVERDAAARAVEDSLRAKQESEKEIARLAVLAAEKMLRK